jgi:hypothetical protein
LMHCIFDFYDRVFIARVQLINYQPAALLLLPSSS